MCCGKGTVILASVVREDVSEEVAPALGESSMAGDICGRRVQGSPLHPFYKQGN